MRNHLPAWIPFAVTLGVFCFGAAMVVLGVTPFSQEPFQVCPNAATMEGSSLTIDLAWWPPWALECEYTTPAGLVTHSTYIPWDEWGAAVLAVVGFGLGSSALVRGRGWGRFSLWAGLGLTLGLLLYFG